MSVAELQIKHYYRTPPQKVYEYQDNWHNSHCKLKDNSYVFKTYSWNITCVKRRGSFAFPQITSADFVILSEKCSNEGINTRPVDIPNTLAFLRLTTV